MGFYLPSSHLSFTFLGRNSGNGGNNGRNYAADRVPTLFPLFPPPGVFDDPTDEPPVSALELSEGQRVTRWVYRGFARVLSVRSASRVWSRRTATAGIPMLSCPSPRAESGSSASTSTRPKPSASLPLWNASRSKRTQQENAREALQEADDAIARANRVLQRLREVAG